MHHSDLGQRNLEGVHGPSISTLRNTHFSIRRSRLALLLIQIEIKCEEYLVSAMIFFKRTSSCMVTCAKHVARSRLNRDVAVRRVIV